MARPIIESNARKARPNDDPGFVLEMVENRVVEDVTQLSDITGIDNCLSVGINGA